ncbi:MAG TPA: type II toxin-antitoxin system VapC family toxin [Dehalococcoidia bacterium]|nr:type II toxin-antitoxin system VapC family toxin [Dehalococcoidia bacterium]
MSSSVLDASAVLAYLRDEPGKDRVEQAREEGAALGAVNLSEVVARLAREGLSENEIRMLVDRLSLEIIPFEKALAYQTGILLPVTQHRGLSLGDRACLALAARLGLPALTADRGWAGLQLGVAIELVR